MFQPSIIDVSYYINMKHPWKGVKTILSHGNYTSGVSEYTEAGFKVCLQKYLYEQIQ